MFATSAATAVTGCRQLECSVTCQQCRGSVQTVPQLRPLPEDADGQDPEAVGLKRYLRTEEGGYMVYT